MALIHVLDVQRDRDSIRVTAAFHLPVKDDKAAAVLSRTDFASAVSNISDAELFELRSGRLVEIVRTLRFPVDHTPDQIRQSLEWLYSRLADVQVRQLVSNMLQQAELAGICWDGRSWSRP